MSTLIIKIKARLNIKTKNKKEEISVSNRYKNNFGQKKKDKMHYLYKSKGVG